MNTSTQLLVLAIVVSVVYVIYTIQAQRRIFAKSHRTKRTNTINSVLIWAIPFFYWGIFKKSIIGYPRGVTKVERDHRKNKSGSFRESGLGMYS